MNKKNSVIFLFHDSILNGGATRSMLDIIVKLKQSKLIEPIIIYPDKDESMLVFLDKHDIKYYHIKYSTWFYNKKQRVDKKIIYWIKSIIKHFITYFNCIRIKKIIREENVKIVYTNTRTVYLGCYLKRKFNLIHIWHIREFGRQDHEIDFIFGEKYFYKLLNKYTDEIIVISESLKENYVNGILDKEKIHVFYDDIDDSFINPKDEFNNTDTLNIAMIGSIIEGKGQIDAINAIKRLKDKKIKLYIAGKKTQYQLKLEEYVKKECLEDKIEFVGYIENINDFRKKMDVGIVASKSEAFGRTTVEGMLSQMLIVASNAGCNRELIKDGKNGFLYELNNDEELANIILKVYEDRSILKEIAIKGFESAKKFTQATTALSIHKLIDSCIKDKK